jgi:hypothetical protein
VLFRSEWAVVRSVVIVVVVVVVVVAVVVIIIIIIIVIINIIIHPLQMDSIVGCSKWPTAMQCENAGPRSITEAKQHRASLVRGLVVPSDL